MLTPRPAGISMQGTRIATGDSCTSDESWCTGAKRYGDSQRIGGGREAIGSVMTENMGCVLVTLTERPVISHQR